uniref:RNA helicase n=1 Tax=Ditylenchus dipsaci TaxID=166011 RepID=A0A915CW82_9BILA
MLENLERLRKKKLGKVSKNKQKKLAKMLSYPVIIAKNEILTSASNMSSTAPDGSKVNKKKLENLERLRKKKLGKVSKNKQKKLAKMVERKKVKETRDSLVEKLLQYQLSDSFMQNLVSTAKMQTNPGNITDENKSRAFPKKLRCVSGKEMENSREKRVQANHYDTGSSSSEDEVDPSPEEASEVPISQTENLEVKEEVAEVVSAPHLAKPNISSKVSSSLPANQSQQSQKQQKSAMDSQKFFKALETIKGAHVVVKRKDDIEAQRSKLPIHAEEQPIVEAINESTVVIICGETGSGKTTQVPQFLYEAGYTSNGHIIGVTEPRRMAAISMSERVGQELSNASLASYQIRFEGNRTEDTKILFMTDGVLLKEVQSDPTLSKFSVIVIDEAHERSIYSDVLIGMLSRICVARLKRGFPLKLIIMSATLRLSDFLQKKLAFRQKTSDDYLKAAFLKVCKIHERLPVGGILVFLSGQREVEQLIKWLNSKYSLRSHKRRNDKKSRKQINAVRDTEVNILPDDGYNEDMVIDYEEFGVGDVDARDNLRECDTMRLDVSTKYEERFPPLHCLPLYSLLPSEKQKLIFQPVPEGSRLCVVATNVAETSLTIPNIRYVVDSGKEKRRDFDPITGVSQFNVGWISRASADQRSGRAGRVQAGHTYRLYSSPVYEDFIQFSPPEILCKPIDQLVLHLKSMGFQVMAAEACLIRLEALVKTNQDGEARISKLGQKLAQFPLSPQFAKLLVTSSQQNILPYVVALVSALSVREPLVSVASIHESTAIETQNAMAEVLKQRRAWCNFGEARHLGDLCVLLNVLGAADHEIPTSSSMQSLGLKPKAYWEIRKLRHQLANLLNSSGLLTEELDSKHKLLPPSQDQLRLIREKMTFCLSDQIARRVDHSADSELDVPKGAYKCQKLQEFVFIEQTSMLSKCQPDYVLFHEILQIGQKKCLINVCAVEEEWVPEYAKSRLRC